GALDRSRSRCFQAVKKISNFGFRPNWLRADNSLFGFRKTSNGNTVLQGNSHRWLSDEAEADGPETVPARADAGAAVSLQPCLRRLRQDRLSRCDPQSPDDPAGMLGCGRRMRRTDGGDPGRRTADPQGYWRNRSRPCCTQEVRLALHQRASAREEAAPVRALALPVLLGPPRRPQGPSRQGRV